MADVPIQGTLPLVLRLAGFLAVAASFRLPVVLGPLPVPPNSAALDSLPFTHALAFVGAPIVGYTLVAVALRGRRPSSPILALASGTGAGFVEAPTEQVFSLCLWLTIGRLPTGESFNVALLQFYGIIFGGPCVWGGFVAWASGFLETRLSKRLAGGA